MQLLLGNRLSRHSLYEDFSGSTAQVLLGDRTNRFSMESVKSVDYKKQEQLLESAAAAAAAKKLTLLDLIEDQGAKAGAPAPGMHLTRQRAAHEQFQKKIAATRASLGKQPPDHHHVPTTLMLACRLWHQSWYLDPPWPVYRYCIILCAPEKLCRALLKLACQPFIL